MLKDYQKRLKELRERATELSNELDYIYTELYEKGKEKEAELEEYKNEEQREIIKDEINYINCLKEATDNMFYVDLRPYEELEERWGKVE